MVKAAHEAVLSSRGQGVDLLIDRIRGLRRAQGATLPPRESDSLKLYSRDMLETILFGAVLNKVQKVDTQ